MCLVTSVFDYVAGSFTGSGVCSSVRILFNSFIGNNLFLNLSRIFSLAINNNAKLFKKRVFFKCFCTAFFSTFSIDNFPSYISLKKQ